MTVASHLIWNFSLDPYQRQLDPSESPSCVWHNDLRMRSRFAFDKEPRAANYFTIETKGCYAKAIET
jgi:hypothetical protein